MIVYYKLNIFLKSARNLTIALNPRRIFVQTLNFQSREWYRAQPTHRISSTLLAKTKRVLNKVSDELIYNLPPTNPSIPSPTDPVTSYWLIRLYDPFLSYKQEAIIIKL